MTMLEEILIAAVRGLKQAGWRSTIWAQVSGKLFTAAAGAPMHPDVLSGWFHNFLRTTDLPQIHLHRLRHFQASMLRSKIFK